MGVFTFQLMSPRGGEPFDHSLLDELHEALQARGVPLTSLHFDGHVSEEDLRRGHGYVAGIAPPVAAFVSLTVEARSRDEIRSTLQLAVTDLGRPDVEVVNA